jgi:hypothetical protein
VQTSILTVVSAVNDVLPKGATASCTGKLLYIKRSLPRCRVCLVKRDCSTVAHELANQARVNVMMGT